MIPYDENAPDYGGMYQPTPAVQPTTPAAPDPAAIMAKRRMIAQAMMQPNMQQIQNSPFASAAAPIGMFLANQYANRGAGS